MQWWVIIATLKTMMNQRKAIDAMFDALPNTTNKADAVAAKMVERTRGRRTGMNVMRYEDDGNLKDRTLGFVFDRSASWGAD
jgi:hypothetical protein